MTVLATAPAVPPATNFCGGGVVGVDSVLHERDHVTCARLRSSAAVSGDSMAVDASGSAGRSASWWPVRGDQRQQD